MKIPLRYIIFTFFVTLLACNDDESNNLPTVETRVAEAISNLTNMLTASENGWRIYYQPTSTSGTFLMLMDFQDDGEVRIQSDLAQNDGEYFDQTIPYRVDNAMTLELIFETYGALHYLFEQENALFGAEFEFVYVSETDGNLLFESKSDEGTPSQIYFEQANATDSNLFSRDIATNLLAFSTISPKALETPQPKQQLILEEENISVYWSLNPSTRILSATYAGVGTTLETTTANGIALDHESGYKLENGALILDTDIEFVLNNTAYDISQIAFDTFSENGPSLCSISSDATPVYEGSVSGLGNATMNASLFDFGGTYFQPLETSIYSVNIPYLFDEETNSLAAEGGIIAEYFPNAVGFAFFYGLNVSGYPANGVGLIVEDDSGNSYFFLREFEETETIGNRLDIAFTDNYYEETTFTDDDRAHLEEITDLLFDGGQVYASYLPDLGGDIFKLFNPCNQYEMLLVM